MRAVTITGFGATPEVTDQPAPRPGQGEILVRMSAAGLNPFDWKVVDGALPDAMFPLVLGADGAGTVTEAGPGVTRFEPGDPVFGQFSRAGRGQGSYAELAVGREGGVAMAPATIALSEAAAVPTAGMTALNLLDDLGLGRGARLLVVGATGGVGTFVVQLAAARGINVLATAGPAKTDLMRGLGAADVIDHTAGPVVEQAVKLHPEGADALIDLVSHTEALRALLPAVRPGARVLSPVFAVPGGGFPDVDAANFTSASDATLLERLAAEIDGGRLRPVIGSTVTLNQAPAALARSRTGRATGKTVIVV